MFDFDLVAETLVKAKAIAWDTCHKIYLLMDDEQVALMREYEYDPIITTDEMTPEKMLDTVKEWFGQSCSLRFVSAVETNHDDPNLGFWTLIEQGATEHDTCEDCLSDTCTGDCEWEDEDEDEE
jgi:hypothetical protein